MQIKELCSREEIFSSFAIIKQIYPNVKEEKYVSIVLNMMQRGYKLAAVVEDLTAQSEKEIKCAGIIGIRIYSKLQHGEVLEIEDFMICRNKRGVGVGKMLIRWAEWQALTFQCNKIICSLDSTRLESHKILSREKFTLEGFHFRKNC